MSRPITCYLFNFIDVIQLELSVSKFPLPRRTENKNVNVNTLPTQTRIIIKRNEAFIN